MITAICLPDQSLVNNTSIRCSPNVFDQLKIGKQEMVTFHFGSLTVEGVTVIRDNKLNNKTDHRPYFAPSRDVFQLLRLQSHMHFKIRRREDGSLEIGPTIGFLLGDSACSYTPKYMEKFMDRFSIYKEIQGLFCAFAEENIDWENKIAYGLYYNPNGLTLDEQWMYGAFPIPNVIYRRYFHNNDESVERLKQITGFRLFNSDRFSKYDFYKLLRNDPTLSPHLPKTITLSLNLKLLKKFLISNNEVILKPIDLSRGRGIFYIKYSKWRGVTVIDHRPERPIKHDLPKRQLIPYLQSEIPQPDKYLIQALIPMAQVYSAPFDIRVVMQKNEEGMWVCNGMEARHAVEGSFVTNLAKGGHASSVDEALIGAFGNRELVKRKMEEIKKMSKRICRCIEEGTTNSHFAEFGIDLGIDKNGKIWIIEANVYPSFKGIKHFKMSHYRKIRYTPLRYAYAISGFYE